LQFQAAKSEIPEWGVFVGTEIGVYFSTPQLELFVSSAVLAAAIPIHPRSPVGSY
jgi:hypothetical protein